jgi:hypothetical protein
LKPLPAGVAGAVQNQQAGRAAVGEHIADQGVAFKFNFYQMVSGCSFH